MLLEDIVVGLEGAHDVHKPALVRLVLVVDCGVHEVVGDPYLEELLEQHFFVWRSFGN